MTAAGVTAVFDELCRDMRKIRDAHEEDERIDACRKTRPIHLALCLCRVFVPRDDGKRGRNRTMRDRNARIGRHRNRRRDAGNNRKGNAVLFEKQCLLTAAPKDKGIAALQAHDNLSLLRFIYEELIDIALFHRVLCRCLANVDEFLRPLCMRENAAVG